MAERDPGLAGRRGLGGGDLLASDWLQVIRADPRLPASHLPADWPAAKAESLFVEIDKTVAQPAGEIARQILDLRPTAENQA